MQKVIEKIEHEIEFQKKQAKEHKRGIFQDEILFARYDQAAKILEWVLNVLREETEKE